MHDTLVLIGPILVQILTGMVTIVLGILSHLLYQVLSKHLSKQDFDLLNQFWAIFHSAAEAAAEKWWASQAGTLSNLVVDLRDPVIADLAREAIAKIPNEISALGFTQEKAETEMADLILSKIGKLQAQSPGAAIPAKGA
jgi:hypothetical protein